MRKKLGEVQEIVLGYVSRWADGCYQVHIYEFSRRKGCSKQAISRAIETLQERGLIAMKGHGEFVKYVLLTAGEDHAGKN